MMCSRSPLWNVSLVILVRNQSIGVHGKGAVEIGIVTNRLPSQVRRRKVRVDLIPETPRDRLGKTILPISTSSPGREDREILYAFRLSLQDFWKA